MTHWTPDFVDRVRALAEQGYSAKQVAGMLFLSVGNLTQNCCKRNISFQRMPKSKRPRIDATIPHFDPLMSTEERLQQAARADLVHQIALARAEAATAPIYRGGWT